MARFLDFIPTEEELERFDSFIVDYIKQGKPITPINNETFTLPQSDSDTYSKR